MRSFYHSPLCLPRVPPFLVELDSQATPFHRVCIAQDQTPSLCHLRRPRPLATTQGAFPDRSGILGSPSFYKCIHACVQSYLRRHLLQQVLVHRCPGHVPATGDKSDGERNVPVPRVGAKRRPRHPARLRGDDSQGLRRPRSLPHLYSTIDEEDDATTHRQPLRCPLDSNSFTFVRAAASVATQACISPSPSPRGVHDPAHHPRYPVSILYAVDVTSVIGISPHPTRHRGPHRQDRFRVVLTRSRKSRGHSRRLLKNQDVRVRLSFGVVIRPYCTSSPYSPRTVVLKTSLIVYSPLFQVAHPLFKDLSIPYRDYALRWATGGCGDGLLCFISHWASAHTHVVSIAAYKLFFVGICTS